MGAILGLLHAPEAKAIGLEDMEFHPVTQHEKKPTFEEQLERIKKECGGDEPIWIQMDDSTVRAIQKQDGMMPKFTKGKTSRLYDEYNCGRCGFIVRYDIYKYCPHCGQKIDWSQWGRMEG